MSDCDCKKNTMIIVGSAVLETDGVFYDVVQCVKCGQVHLIAPKQVIIHNINDSAVTKLRGYFLDNENGVTVCGDNYNTYVEEGQYNEFSK